MNVITNIKRRIYVKEHFNNIEKNNNKINLDEALDILYNYRDVLSGYEFICYDRLVRQA